MFCFKFDRVKKGFTLIYVVLICSLCITMVLAIFKLQVTEVKFNKSYMRDVLKQEKIQEYEECLFTKTNNYILVNINQLSDEGIKNYFGSNYQNFKIIYSDAYIIYNNTNNCFTIFTSVDNQNHREDTYNYKVQANKINFTHRDTLYKEGKLLL